MIAEENICDGPAPNGKDEEEVLQEIANTEKVTITVAPQQMPVNTASGKPISVQTLRSKYPHLPQ